MAELPLLSVTVTWKIYEPATVPNCTLGIDEFALMINARSFSDVHTNVSGLFPTGLVDFEASSVRNR